MMTNWLKVFAKPKKIYHPHWPASVNVHPSVSITLPKQVHLDENVKLNSGVQMHLATQRKGFPAGRISIGENSLVSHDVILFAGRGSISIGAYCELGLRVTIVAQKRTLSTKQSPGPEGLQWFETQIGDECLFGSGAIITEGSVIGNGCIIGAGAVVQGHFADNTILIGNPARPVPKRKN